MEFFEFAQVAEPFVILSFNSNDPARLIWLTLLIGGLCYLLVYTFQAIALYTIAKREGYKHKWMAFVPFFNTFYIGVLAEKNKIRGVKPTVFSGILAGLEVVYVALSVLYYVAIWLLLSGNYLVPVHEPITYGGVTLDLIAGFEPAPDLPVTLNWAYWVFAYLQDFVLSWLSLIYLVLNVFVLMSFFQTYASRRFWLFSLFSVLFPVKGILFFAVRNNKGVNYREYIKEMQQRQYRMYQEYMRQNMNNPYNYNPYTGKTEPPPQDDAYKRPPEQPQSDDPFGEFSSDTDKREPPDEPFDKL